jgi:hypothetical protein
VHDAISLERAGIPTATVCTADFLPGGRMQAASMHMPDYAVICVPQEYITRARADVPSLAAACLDDVIRRLTVSAGGGAAGGGSAGVVAAGGRS